MICGARARGETFSQRAIEAGRDAATKELMIQRPNSEPRSTLIGNSPWQPFIGGRYSHSTGQLEDFQITAWRVL